jgi:transcriptional regulator with XRE-family HTH domain
MELGTLVRMSETRDETEERADRLDLALAHAGMKATALADALGITSASLSEIKKGKSKAPERWLQISKKLGVDAEWLMYGTGRPPTWAGDSVYGITISSRDDRSGLNDAVSVARTLYESNTHGLVESLFFDTNLGTLSLREKPGITESDRERICDALSRLQGLSCLVEYGPDYYPDPNEVDPDILERENIKEAQRIAAENRDLSPPLEEGSPHVPAWVGEILKEVRALRTELTELRRTLVQPDDQRRREGVETRDGAGRFVAGHALDPAGDERLRTATQRVKPMNAEAAERLLALAQQHMEDEDRG